MMASGAEAPSSALTGVSESLLARDVEAVLPDGEGAVVSGDRDAVLVSVVMAGLCLDRGPQKAIAQTFLPLMQVKVIDHLFQESGGGNAPMHL